MTLDTEQNTTEEDVMNLILDRLIENIDKTKWKYSSEFPSITYRLIIGLNDSILLSKSIIPKGYLIIIYNKGSEIMRLSTNKDENKEYLEKVEKLFNLVDKKIIVKKQNLLGEFLITLNKLVEEEKDQENQKQK